MLCEHTGDLEVTERVFLINVEGQQKLSSDSQEKRLTRLISVPNSTSFTINNDFC